MNNQQILKSLKITITEKDHTLAGVKDFYTPEFDRVQEPSDQANINDSMRKIQEMFKGGEHDVK